MGRIHLVLTFQYPLVNNHFSVDGIHMVFTSQYTLNFLSHLAGSHLVLTFLQREEYRECFLLLLWIWTISSCQCFARRRAYLPAPKHIDRTFIYLNFFLRKQSINIYEQSYHFEQKVDRMSEWNSADLYRKTPDTVSNIFDVHLKSTIIWVIYEYTYIKPQKNFWN